MMNHKFISLKCHVSYLLITACVIALGASCKTSKQTVRPVAKQKFEKRLTEDKSSMFVRGIDFYGKSQGSKQGWSVEITKTDTILFRDAGGIKIHTAGKRSFPSDRSIKYSSIGSSIATEVIIGEDVCDNGEYAVQVNVSGKTYTGCGSFLFNNALDGKWMLENINGKAINSKQYKSGLPYLHFDLKKRQLKGFDGCNRFYGGFATLGASLKFYDQSMTKKKCGSNDFSNKFNKFINNKLVSYTIKDNSLLVYLLDDSMLTFKKAN